MDGSLLHKIIESRMTGELTGRRRIHMLRELANDDANVALIRAAEDSQVVLENGH